MKREVVVNECDGCGKFQLVTDEMEALGLEGTVIETTKFSGGIGGDWHACSRKCVAKAITTVLDRRDDEEETKHQPIVW